jgi:hypothetical protein
MMVLATAFGSSTLLVDMLVRSCLSGHVGSLITTMIRPSILLANINLPLRVCEADSQC